MKNVALITGASSGIGMELARYHASKGGDLALVARREKVLKELKKELENSYNTKSIIIPTDLSKSNSYKEIYNKTREENIQIDILINNAGFGDYGKFYECSLEKAQAMVQVNITSLIGLTHIYLQDMVKRNSGKILNVASIAAFMPGPLMATYYATKSFVLSFSQAIARELSDTKITVTALCPGPVNTGFVDAGNLKGVSAWKNADTPRSVAKIGYDAMMKGKLVEFNKRSLKFAANWIFPFLPKKTLLKMSEKFIEKDGK
jgi:short-subunit dehydrogenase